MSFEDLYVAHLLAFKDYPFQWTRNELLKTMARRGYKGDLSFGAFCDEELASFTFNGIGNYNSIYSAYDTGTGTIETYRRKGLASQVFEYSIPHLKVAGVKQYVLEVLEENTDALSVYTKQGFKTTRKFDCFRVNMLGWKYTFRKPDGVELEEIDLRFKLQMEAMLDFPLSWQNSFEAVARNPDDFIMLGAFSGDNLLGYGIMDTEAGDLTQLAVRRLERGRGIGSWLLRELKVRNKANIMKAVNIESTQKSIIHFLEKRGLSKIVSQLEMVRTL